MIRLPTQVDIPIKTGLKITDRSYENFKTRGECGAMYLIKWKHFGCNPSSYVMEDFC